MRIKTRYASVYEGSNRYGWLGAGAKKAVVVGSDIASRHDAKVILVYVLLRHEVSVDLRRMGELEDLIAGDQPLTDALATAPMDRFLTQLSFPGHDLEMPDKVLLAIGEQILGKAEQLARKEGVRQVSKRIEDGKTADRILGIAKSEGVDTIVCGARGLSNVAAILVGSVSHRLLHHPSVTCVAVRQAQAGLMFK